MSDTTPWPEFCQSYEARKHRTVVGDIASEIRFHQDDYTWDPDGTTSPAIAGAEATARTAAAANSQALADRAARTQRSRCAGFGRRCPSAVPHDPRFPDHP